MTSSRDIDVNSSSDLPQALDDIIAQSQSLHITKDDTSIPQPSLMTNGTLKPHQRTGLSWLVHHYTQSTGCILGDEMGLGKTLQAICSIAYLLENSYMSNPVLIICPLSVVRNWCNEINQFTPSIDVLTYVGNKDERAVIRSHIIQQIKSQSNKNDPELDFDILITTYELAVIDQGFLKRFRWRYFIMDEAHRLKNPNSVLYQTLDQQYHLPHRVLLTGTPLQNNMAELYSLLHFTNPDLFPLSRMEEFATEWFPPGILKSQKQRIKNEHQDVSNNSRLEMLQSILKTFLLRRHKTQVLSLPEKREYVLYTELTSMQQKYYKAVLTKDKDALGKQNYRKLINVLMQLRKCCNHPYLFEGAEPEPFSLGFHIIKNSAKMIVLDKLLKNLKENGHKVLIFSQMTAMLDILQDYLHYREYRYERLDGSVRGEERYMAIDAFNKKSDDNNNNDNNNDNDKDNVFAFLLSTRAGGLGLNLTAADSVIFFDSDWNPQMDLQAQERVYRIGQTKPVRVFRFATQSSVEEIILKRATKKLKMAQTVVDSFGMKNLNEDVVKGQSADQLLDVIKYGLGSLIKDDTSNQQKQNDQEKLYEDLLLNTNIEDILKKGDLISSSKDNTADTTEGQSCVYSESESESENETIDEEKEYQSIRSLIPRQLVSREDSDALNQLMSSNQSKKHHSNDDDEDDEKLLDTLPSGRWSNVKTRSMRKKRSRSSDIYPQQSKKKRRRGHRISPERYESLNIQIPNDEDVDESNNIEQINIDEIDDENEKRGEKYRSINYCIGDVTNPPFGTSPRIIFTCVSDSGRWGRGGLFTQLKHKSRDIVKAYEAAGRHDDLHLGNTHLVPIPETGLSSGDSDSDSEIDQDLQKGSNTNVTYIALGVVQQHNPEPNVKVSGIIQKALIEALKKVSFAARKIGATVHLPRIGAGLPGFDWYSTERSIRKYLVQRGVKTFVYYYKPGMKPSLNYNNAQQHHNQYEDNQSVDIDDIDVDVDIDFDDAPISNSLKNSSSSSSVQNLNQNYSEPKRKDLSSRTVSDASKDNNNNNNNNNNGDDDNDDEQDIFEDVKFLISSSFDNSIEIKQIKRKIMSYGGIVVTEPYQADYIITSDPTSNASASSEPPHVTLEWVHNCIQSNKIVS